MRDADNGRNFWKRSSLCLALFLLALLPRLFGLSVFITPDERRWIQRSVLFFSALLEGDWANTFQSGHPGVTTKWMGAIGLLGKYLFQARAQPSLSGLKEFLAAVPVHPTISVDYLAAARLPTVLLTSLCVAIVYLLVKKLFDERIALLGAILLALDPFYLAHSRVIHHDALATTFMTLSVLSFTIYLWRDRSRLYLGLSAVSAGLSFLSKGSSLFLGPLMAFLALLAYLFEMSSYPQARWTAVKRWAAVLIIWAFLALLTFALLWPVVWVDPLKAVGGLLDKAVGYAEEAHTKGNFFLGQAVADPGPLFYPMTLLLRVTPLTLIGSVWAFYLWIRACYWGARRKGNADKPLGERILGTLLGENHGSEERYRVRGMTSLWFYAFLFTIFMTLGDKKFDRYILPVYPALEILATVGLYLLMKGAALHFRERGWGKRYLTIFIPGVALILQAAFSLPHFPYYLTHYNPLAGGNWLAPKVITVGWGEGLDLAAEYLNGKENAFSVKVASWYHRELMPFFVGSADRLDVKSDRNLMPWHMSDYVVFYLNQVQRHNPGEALVQYFRSLEPEHVVRLKGIDYAWIYPTPDYIPDEVVPAQYVQRARFGHDLLFLGYDLDGDRVPIDGKVWTSLYWQGLRHIETSYRMYLKLVNSLYHVWGEQEGRPLWDRYPTDQWPRGVVVKDTRSIEVLPGTPPGFYQVVIDLYDPANGRWVRPEEGGGLVIGPVEIPRQEPLDVEALDIQHPVGADLEDKARLLGYNIRNGFRPGDKIELTLFWQALSEMDKNYTVFTHLVDEKGKIWGQKDNEPVDGLYPTTAWKEGEIVRDQYDLVTASDIPPGEYPIEVGMYLAETGERLKVLRGKNDFLENRVLLEKVQIRD